MSNDKTCAQWRCENDVVEGYEFCEEHPPLVHHGLKANETECPHCGEVGAGTIYDDLWYCYNGCGEIFDPYKVADVEKRTVDFDQ